MIRNMEREEISSAVRVIRGSFLTVAEELGFTPENAPGFTAFSMTEEKLLGQMEAGRIIRVFCDENNEIVGCYALAQQGKVCELNYLCVLPIFRHRNAGGALLADAIMQAGKLACDKITLSIVEENKRLRAWYEGQGFIHTGVKKFDFFPFTCGYLEKKVAPRGDANQDR